MTCPPETGPGSFLSRYDRARHEKAASPFLPFPMWLPDSRNSRERFKSGVKSLKEKVDGPLVYVSVGPRVTETGAAVFRAAQAARETPALRPQLYLETRA
jgi:hypothetical protein